MENPLALRLWISVALYAALGVFGIVIFHDATPSIQNMTDGYGVAYTAIAAPATAK
jgi:hypothetical protein